MAEDPKPQTTPTNTQQAAVAEKKAIAPDSIVHIVTPHGDHLNAKVVKLDKSGKVAELQVYLPADKKGSPSTIKGSPLDVTAMTSDSWHPIEDDESGDDVSF